MNASVQFQRALLLWRQVSHRRDELCPRAGALSDGPRVVAVLIGLDRRGAHAVHGPEILVVPLERFVLRRRFDATAT